MKKKPLWCRISSYCCNENNNIVCIILQIFLTVICRPFWKHWKWKMFRSIVILRKRNAMQIFDEFLYVGDKRSFFFSWHICWFLGLKLQAYIDLNLLTAGKLSFSEGSTCLGISPLTEINLFSILVTT